MIVTDRLIYLRLQKTASRHIADLLVDLYGAERRGQHRALAGRRDGRMVVGSVRNPWDWYLSLWAFGCAKGGQFRGHLTRPQRAWVQLRRRRTWQSAGSVAFHARQALVATARAHRWRRTYGDPADADRFRQWLRLMFGGDQFQTAVPPPIRHRLCASAGFMTYRYCSIFFDPSIWRDTRFRIEDVDALRTVDRDHNVLDRTILVENLEADLIESLRAAGHEVPPEAEARILAAAQKPAHKSAHGDAAEYYDAETSEMIAAREQFIVEKYGYTSPLW